MALDADDLPGKIFLGFSQVKGQLASCKFKGHLCPAVNPFNPVGRLLKAGNDGLGGNGRVEEEVVLLADVPVF